VAARDGEREDCKDAEGEELHGGHDLQMLRSTLSELRKSPTMHGDWLRSSEFSEV
jgi:hypothetical protein